MTENRKKTKFILAVLMILIMTASSFSCVFADEDVSDKQDKLAENQEMLEDTEKELKELKADIDTRQEKLDKLEKNIKKTTKEVAKTQKDLNEIKENIEKQNEDTNARLRMIYMNDDASYIDILLNSGSISELLTNLDMMKIIHKNDKEVLDRMETTFAQITDKEAELAEKKASLEKKQKKASDSLNELEAQKAKLETEAKRIQEENEKLEQEIQRMIAAAEAIEDAGAAGDVEWNGDVMEWPVSSGGRISCEYGPRICPFHGREVHRGIDISCPHGTPIVAAEDGVVVKAGWGGSYGNIVIISHGGGISTVYGHNSSLTVSSGQHVKRGDVIAKAGATGSATGNHCHFEVRINGQHTNPNPFLGR